LELVVALIFLYAAQCLKLLPAGSAMVGRLGRGRRLWEGGGWRLLSPLPFRVAHLGTRLPIREGPDGLRAIAPVSRFAFAPEPGPGLPFVPGRVERVEGRGKMVWVDGRPFARAIHRRQALLWLALLSDLAGCGPVEARSRLAAAVASGFDLSRFRARQEDFTRACRALRWSGGAYFTGLFLLSPVLVWVFHTEQGLALSLPVLIALHLATLVSLGLAHRRLLPDAAGERVELLIAAFLYPPGLLRGLQELANEVTSGFHPAVLACALLDDEDRHRFLRIELGRLMQLREAAPAPGLGVAELELRALLGLAEAIGESESSLLTPPARVDPMAERYCPVCLTEYRATVDGCSDCGTQLRAYGTV
jgi:hypothetical protein